jgi:hypothetical protein
VRKIMHLAHCKVKFYKVNSQKIHSKVNLRKTKRANYCRPLGYHSFHGNHIYQTASPRKIILNVATDFAYFKNIVVTYFQFDSNIRVLYVFLGFLKNT